MKRGILIVMVMMAVAFGANAQKYGHVDTQKMLAELPSYKKAEDSLQKFADQLRAEIDNQQKVFQQRVKEFEEGQAAGLFSPEIEQSRYQELQEKNVKMQEYSQVTAPQLLQEKEAALLEPLVQQVKDAIKKVGTDNKYTYIFDSNIILFYDGGDDVGPLVRKELGIAE